MSARVKSCTAGCWGHVPPRPMPNHPPLPPLAAREEAVREARDIAHKHGHRTGYRAGVAWGALCGFCWGCFAGAAVTALAFKLGIGL